MQPSTHANAHAPSARTHLDSNPFPSPDLPMCSRRAGLLSGWLQVSCRGACGLHTLVARPTLTCTFPCVRVQAPSLPAAVTLHLSPPSPYTTGTTPFPLQHDQRANGHRPSLSGLCCAGGPGRTAARAAPWARGGWWEVVPCSLHTHGMAHTPILCVGSDSQLPFLYFNGKHCRVLMTSSIYNFSASALHMQSQTQQRRPLHAGWTQPGISFVQLDCAHTHTHARTHAHTHARTHACMHTHTRTHTHAHTHAYIHAYIHGLQTQVVGLFGNLVPEVAENFRGLGGCAPLLALQHPCTCSGRYERHPPSVTDRLNHARPSACAVQDPACLPCPLPTCLAHRGHSHHVLCACLLVDHTAHSHVQRA